MRYWYHLFPVNMQYLNGKLELIILFALHLYWHTAFYVPHPHFGSGVSHPESCQGRVPTPLFQLEMVEVWKITLFGTFFLFLSVCYCMFFGTFQLRLRVHMQYLLLFWLLLSSASSFLQGREESAGRGGGIINSWVIFKLWTCPKMGVITKPDLITLSQKVDLMLW